MNKTKLTLALMGSMAVTSAFAIAGTDPDSYFKELQEKVTINTHDNYGKDGWDYINKFTKSFTKSRVIQASEMTHKGRYGWDVEQEFYTDLSFSVDDANIEKVSIVNTGDEYGHWIHAFDNDNNELTNEILTRDDFNSRAASGVHIKVISAAERIPTRINPIPVNIYYNCESYGNPGELKLKLDYRDGDEVYVDLFHTKVDADCEANDKGVKEAYPVTTLISDIYSISENQSKYYYNSYLKKIVIS